MNQQITIASSPAYLIVCIACALGFAFLLYRTNHPWSKTWNRVLFGIRFILSFLLMFLLLGPIVKQINTIFEKPLFIILHDNSASVKEGTDSLTLRKTHASLEKLQQTLTNNGYNTQVGDLSGNETTHIRFTHTSTDLHGALKRIMHDHEGRKIAGVILPSDGVFNTGLSPLYATYNFPVYTVGLGDTVERTDLSIKNIAYNKIAYQGNKFPVRVEVLAKNLPGQTVNVRLLQRGKVIEQQTKKTTHEQLVVFDFHPLASAQGMQKIDIQVGEKPGEHNTRNNYGSIYMDVVEGKKKILLIAPAPHPDMKSLREVVEKNSNYEFLLHIPGVSELAPASLKDNQVDLVILHQVPDVRGRTHALFQQFVKAKTSLLIILGQQSDLRLLARHSMPVKFEAPPRDYDQVTPVMNNTFNYFSVSPETTSLLTDYPPVSVHFGRIKIPLSATPILYQRIGSVPTEKPLMAVDVQDGRKIGIMLGEGLWRWRLNEYDRTENTAAFDELFGKLIQYLSTTEDKRKFRSYPIQQEFADTEPVIFESQVYNDIFEPVFGNTINIDITNEQGKKTTYSYVTSPGNSRYQIGDLEEGVYRYKARTILNNKPEEVRGEFAVMERQAELQNLTADFSLLRKLSANTGGKFYKPDQLDGLQADLARMEATSVIHSEESYDSLINLKWVFWLLLTFVSLEWFTRKYFGSY